MTSPGMPKVLTVREFGSDALRGLQRRGELDRIRRGAYRRPLVADSPWDRASEELLARCVAVADRLTTRFAFSHETAALLHRWPVTVRPGVVDVVQTVLPTRCGRTDIRRHVRSGLTDADIVEVAGLPVTTPARTAIDCARVLSPQEGLIVADGALRQLAAVEVFARSTSESRQEAVRAELVALLSALGPGRHVVRARAVLTFADGFSASPGETRTRWLGLVAGLPAPICQWEVAADGRRYFSDIAWPATGPDWPARAITFEYDGAVKYDGNGAVAAVVADEKVRQDAIESTGVAVHRVTRGRLADPELATSWLLSKFPDSVRARLTPRRALAMPPD